MFYRARIIRIPIYLAPAIEGYMEFYFEDPIYSSALASQNAMRQSYLFCVGPY